MPEDDHATERALKPKLLNTAVSEISPQFYTTIVNFHLGKWYAKVRNIRRSLSQGSTRTIVRLDL